MRLGRMVALSPLVDGVRGQLLQLPCGRCHGCRLERARQWSVRCIHESKLWSRNCFVTLTYNDDCLPEGGSLRYLDFQRFMRRLRRSSPGVRFFMCGEYGEQLSRPHYHACLFNYRPDDLVCFSKSENTYTSASLLKLWGLGHVLVGDVSFQSAGYVARYSLKKVNGDLAAAHYRRVDPDTGEVFDLVPEFAHMSLKPGIGASWFDRFYGDFRRGTVVVDGFEGKAPSYYDKLLKRREALCFEDVKIDREFKAYPQREHGLPDRLRDRLTVSLAKTSQLKRDKV